MSEAIAIAVENVSKAYHIWETPAARLISPLQEGLAGLLPASSALARHQRQQAAARYRDFYALRDVSFSVRRGESVGIIGRNGSGKSTLLQIIAGTLQPSAGRVRVNGRVAALLELGSGFNPDFTGRENVYLNAAVLGLSRREVDARFDQITQFADIGDFIEQPVKTYSSGMLLRLAFAVQIQVEPDILIVDEALSVGDEPFQRKCFAQIAQLQERGVTILFVSHGAATIMELCQRVVLLDHGQCLAVAKPKTGIQYYHQLCYSPADQQAQVRADILNLTAESAETAAPARPAGRPAETAPEKARAYLLASLVSASRNEFPSRGALIESIQLLDAERAPVNVLVKGDDYTLQARVRFTQAAVRVRFGWTAKNITGTVLSGASTHTAGNGFAEFAVGSVVEVHFSLRCLFNPGSYFVDLVVRAETSETDMIIHGIVDALMFRVEPVPGVHRNGHIDTSLDPAWNIRLVPTDNT